MKMKSITPGPISTRIFTGEILTLSISTLLTDTMSIPSTARHYSVQKAGSLDGLKLVEAPVPKLKSTEVLVKVKAVSLQYRDLLVVNGYYPPPIAENVVPCSDMAGEVVAVGEDVTKWKAGDRVANNFFLDLIYPDGMTPAVSSSAAGGAAHGVLTEYRAFPAHALVEIPGHLSWEEAATLPCAALTAYNALVYGYERIKAGDTVLIQGTGGVSIFALQFAVASGATAIVLSSSDEKLAAVTKLGAKHVLNYKTTPDWEQDVLKLTGGRGVDRVIEVVGNATLAKSIAAVRMGGSIDIIGLLGGVGNVTPPDIIGPSLWKQLKFRGIYVGAVSQFEDMNRVFVANPETTRPIVDKVFAFDDANDAFSYLNSQKHVGKVVIRVNQ
ncbi:Alcohol dehydrogenase superfamily protein [Mycena indigotica]|uniref:Alcohol dehydrogenase superfamily protein n=1 Tax=Mycena indigotica TaxID=2126181 RepID=A0A8H6W8T7_9AGAR|nr:Alcohol dehydrogenase superfamily protein [Mycena indigotica]KAF7303474.1 Alcohol dehydrogenase superfamily protein [Mycena indigotica]